MTVTVITPEILNSLYQWLRECAEKKQYCPSNQDICDRYSFKSWSTAVKAIRKLQDDGKITVMRYNRSRQVYVLATQKTTPRQPDCGSRAIPRLPALKSSNAKESARPPTVVAAPKPSQPRPPSDLVASKDLPKPTQANLPMRAPPKFKPGHTTAPERKVGDRRAEELLQMEKFAEAGRVYQCKMGETAFEQDENGVYINPAIRRKYQSQIWRSQRASRASAVTRSGRAKNKAGIR